MARDGSGVSEHGGKIRMSFMLHGKRVRQSLNMAYTPKNILAAEKMLARIRESIRLGTFDFAAEFPDSKTALKLPKPAGVRGKPFGDAVDDYIATTSHLAKNTRKNYRNAGEVLKGILGADTLLRDLTPEKVHTAIGRHPFASGKLRNDYLIVLRGACRLAKLTDPSWIDPSDGLSNAKREEPTPDPLTAEEMVAVLKHMSVTYDPRVHAYFLFQFETGLRPEEAIALRWGDIDLKNRRVHVERARALGEIRPVKTYENRRVDLSAKALKALDMMRPYTHRARSPEREVFQNPNTGEPWHSARSQHENYWTPTLKALRIRHRRAYNTRHTFATLRLMVGGIPAYISRQLGHRSPATLYRYYAKWLDSDTTESVRLEALVEAKLESIA